MAMVTTMPCCGADRCATFEHDWLKHQLLEALQVEKDDWLQSGPSGPIPAVLVAAEEWIAEADDFAKGAIRAFSPCQLVDSGPLSLLPDDARELIKAAVHQSYLDCNLVQPHNVTIRFTMGQAQESRI